MKAQTAAALTNALLQIMQQFPRLRFKKRSTSGLTNSEQGLLLMLVMNLDATKLPLTVGEISSLLQITPAGVTHLINPLEESGYIERLPDANDRRIVRIGVTAKASRSAQALLSDVRQQLSGLVEHLGEADARSLIRLMSRAVEYFAAQSGS